MNSVIKNLLEKNVGLDFKRTLNELSRGNVYVNNIETDIEEVPIDIKKSSWSITDDDQSEKLIKTYQMHDTRHLLYFVNELIKKADYMDHHPTITIEKDSVQVVLYTHDLDAVTESDVTLSQYCDELYEDIVYLNPARGL